MLWVGNFNSARPSQNKSLHHNKFQICGIGQYRTSTRRHRSGSNQDQDDSTTTDRDCLVKPGTSGMGWPHKQTSGLELMDELGGTDTRPRSRWHGRPLRGGTRWFWFRLDDAEDG